MLTSAVARSIPNYKNAASNGAVVMMTAIAYVDTIVIRRTATVNIVIGKCSG